MAAILDFQVAGRVDFISMPIRITVPNLVLVSQFARFFSYPLHYYVVRGAVDTIRPVGPNR